MSDCLINGVFIFGLLAWGTVVFGLGYDYGYIVATKKEIKREVRKKRTRRSK